MNCDVPAASAAGQRVSEWNATTHAQLKGHYYWGGKPVAFYTAGTGGAAHFQHQDWLGTERMRTTYNGGVEGSFTSLPFGDGLLTSGSDTDANHYATIDHDYESDTEHAQFRQYSSAQGHWLSPDPYGGSYDFSNPQSFNRYVYVLNNPLSSVDPSGLNHCDYWWGCGGASDCANDPNCSSGDVTVQDGAPSFGADTLGGGAEVQCPYNDCGPVNIGGVLATYWAGVIGGAYVPNATPGTIFDNEEQATVAGALYAEYQSVFNDGAEYCGGVSQGGSGYTFSDPQANGNMSGCTPPQPWTVSQSGVIVATFHSHGVADPYSDNENFSTEMLVPVFMGTDSTGASVYSMQFQGDTYFSNNWNTPNGLATPGGKVIVYFPQLNCQKYYLGGQFASGTTIPVCTF